MLKTPEEARGMWCPFARVETGELEAMSSALAAVNRSFKLIKRVFGKNEPDFEWDQDLVCNCIADQCMAWRWEFLEVGKPDKGFCGLAGRP